MTDTVGFISNLPHQLIDAFKSTLEEAALADALLIVLDSSDPNALEEAATVLKVLEQIGAGQKPRLVVLNKIDALESPGGEGSERLLVQLAALKERFPDALEASAKSGAGLDLIKRKISDIIKKCENA